jgi:hypothetical protein
VAELLLFQSLIPFYSNNRLRLVELGAIVRLMPANDGDLRSFVWVGEFFATLIITQYISS